jgi:hypothetical protein
MTWKVAGYVAEQLIGYGASSEVWRGRSTRTGQPVALKKVPADTGGRLRSAREEAALLSALDHPNLIRLHEVVSMREALVLVLDLADAGSLADLLHSRGRLTPGEAAGALAGVGAALAYVHGRGVIHGDVSAGNVLFTSFGLSLLADLGVGRLAASAGSISGTPAVVSPEVAVGAIAQRPSDVFSLAAVTYQALVGTSVWGAGTGDELVERARSSVDGPRPGELAQLPPELRRVLGAAFDIDPHRRPSAAEFALDLRLSVPLAPIELRAGGPRPQPVPPQGGRHRRVPGPPAISDAPGRPRFERPAPAAPDRGQLTHGARIPIVRPPARRRLDRRRSLLVAALAVVFAAGAAIALRVRADAPAASLRSVSAGSTGAAPRPDFAARLAALDALRQQAFAERRPDLLTRVYASAALRQQDATLIDQLVPSGCGLLGVRTDYRDVRIVSASADAAELSASAVLSPSTLRCRGQESGTAAGLPATGIRISLVRGGDGFLIDGLRTT